MPEALPAAAPSPFLKPAALQYLRAPMSKPATPAPLSEMKAQTSADEAKDQPAAAVKLTLRELYTRAHWLVIASFETTIAENETVVANPIPPGGKWAYDMIRNSIPLIRERVEEYQHQYDLAMRDNDARLMRRFLENTRSAHGREPKFSFLPEVLPEQ